MEILVMLFLFALVCDEAGLPKSANLCWNLFKAGSVAVILAVLAMVGLFIAGKV